MAKKKPSKPSQSPAGAYNLAWTTNQNFEDMMRVEFPHVKYLLRKDFPVADVSLEKSLQNSPRLGPAVDPDRVATMVAGVTAPRNATYPPALGHRDESGEMCILDGVTRLEVLKAIRATDLYVYELLGIGTAEALMIAKVVNLLGGKCATAEEQCMHAAAASLDPTLCPSPYTAAQIAAIYRISLPSLNRHRNSIRAKTLYAADGAAPVPGASALSTRALSMLFPISKHSLPVFQRAGEVAVRIGKPTTAQVRGLLDAIRRAPATQAAQLKAVDEFAAKAAAEFSALTKSERGLPEKRLTKALHNLECVLIQSFGLGAVDPRDVVRTAEGREIVLNSIKVITPHFKKMRQYF